MRSGGDLDFAAPGAEDGPSVHALIAACPPLDQNSVYANLLQCTHFADTCVAVKREGRLVGWVSGYIPPQEPDVLFVWQVAVAEEAQQLALDKASACARKRLAKRFAVIPPLPDDRFLCGFGHIFAGGYSAGYYSVRAS